MVGSRLTALLLQTILAASLDGAPQPRSPTCAIDMGSNTFRRIVGTFENGRYAQQPIDKRTLGVGDDVARNGRISDAKLTEIGAVLAEFKSGCEKAGATRIVAIGTAAFRDAPNGTRAVDIAAKLGIRMEIATEKRESELAYLVGTLGQDGHAVVDNGSRSIELVAQDGGQPRYLVIELGYRVAYEKFFASIGDPQAAVQAFRSALQPHVAKAPFMKGKKKLVGIEFGEMVDVLFEPKGVEGRVFTLEELGRKLRQITTGGARQFAVLKKKEDIDRALPRLVVAVTVMETFGYSRLELTERELGAGLIIEADIRQR